jgi:hypothetical protein
VVAIAANSRNVDAARQVRDWIAARAPAMNGPRLDVEWTTAQYATARQRWAQNGFAS